MAIVYISILMDYLSFSYGDKWEQGNWAPHETLGVLKARFRRWLKIRSKGQKYNEAATLSFRSYDQFIPNTRQMGLAADAFERVMLAAGGISAPLGYSIGEVESKLKEFLIWSFFQSISIEFIRLLLLLLSETYFDPATLLHTYQQVLKPRRRQMNFC